MEVAVVSVESIKPCLPVCDKKPFNLSLLDQLTPTTYSPLILFYNTEHIHLTSSQIISRLKWSLSKTLSPFYPLSGRVKDNLFIHEFDKGIPFFEARVKGHLSDFLRSPRVEMCDEFLPVQPFCRLPDEAMAQVAIQVNIFDCGGIALGMCCSHKINDGTTGSLLLKSWVANTRGSYDKVIEPKLFEASLMFPPRKSLPSRYASLVERFWFSECGCRTRRFVFDEKAISALRTKGQSEFVENPTRVEALSAFIWQSALKACKTMSDSQRASLLLQAVNIRGLTKPRLPRYSIGNLIWTTSAMYDPDEKETSDLKQLVGLMRESVRKINSEYVKNLSGDKGYAAILKDLDELAEISKENLDVFNVSSWHTFGLNEIDFGWGKPVWAGICGEGSRSNNASDLNSIILKDIIGRNNAIEAWITTDDNTMDFLEHDHEFLAFTS